MKILIGYIRTPESRAALDSAVLEARSHDALLIVAHSMRPDRRERPEEVAAYRKEMEEVEERLDGEGIAYEIRELIRGESPGRDLVQFAREQRVDRIVIGIRRRTAVGKAVLRSRAQEILLGAHCPVLAVKVAEE